MTTSKNTFFGILKEFVETVVIVLVLVILIKNFIGEARWIPSGSMRPTLLEGDRIFVEKISNFISTPKRGDIIVFYPPQEELGQTPWEVFTRLIGFFNKDVAYIKRVVGVPGDLIEIKTNWKNSTNQVYINKKLLDESYVNKEGFLPCRPDMHCGPMIVPQNSYFMMGDNRANSQDSRFWGFLPENRIIGKAVFRFWPINRVGVLKVPSYNIGTEQNTQKEVKKLKLKPIPVAK